MRSERRGVGRLSGFICCRGRVPLSIMAYMLPSIAISFCLPFNCADKAASCEVLRYQSILGGRGSE